LQISDFRLKRVDSSRPQSEIFDLRSEIRRAWFSHFLAEKQRNPPWQ